MAIVFVSGKFRGADHWEIAEHIRAAERLSLCVWRAGAVAVAPHLLTAHFQGALPDRVFLEGDLELLERCDALVTVDNWTDSLGAQAEVAHAITKGIPVFHSLEALASWLARPAAA